MCNRAVAVRLLGSSPALRDCAEFLQPRKLRVGTAPADPPARDPQALSILWHKQRGNDAPVEGVAA